ncbi:hypothetical protein V502_11372 [Pseudogymnoascus sp. VKM F-4520 (FW-2644)]|nr:hypothetical protein V502_11372 [Pseudogymnoascus sp. VKM F-4520 (FW-2644)]
MGSRGTNDTLSSMEKRLKSISLKNAPTHKIIVGIDYGTTFSGVSFVTTDKSSIDDINIISTWPGDPYGSWKTPTRIAYSAENPKISTNKWGFDVYPKLKSYSWTKLLLDKNAAIGEHDDPSLSCIGGPGMFQLPSFRDAPGVCEDFLHEIYLFVSKMLRQQMTDSTFEKTPMECWITLPAIWSDEAKAATLTAARNAGFGHKSHDEVFTIAEPEAAAIATLKKYAEPGALNPVKENENILICDCGGGTVDVTTYTITQVRPYLSFNELCVGVGGKCGSTHIDRNLHALLSERFGSAFDNLPFGVKGPGGRFMSSFEMLKRDFGLTDNSDDRDLGPINLDVPESEYYDPEDSIVKLSYEDMQSLFDPVIKEITSLVGQQVEEAKKKQNVTIDRIILVGGFGESSYLNQALEDWCRKNGGITLLCPEHPQAAVVQGAALRGLEGIAPRVKYARYHYGFSISKGFREGIDSEDNAYFSHFEDKRKLCDNRMQWLISKGDEITKGTCITAGVTTEYSPGSDFVSQIQLYSCTLAEAPEYSTNARVHRVGSIESTFDADFNFGKSTQTPVNLHKGAYKSLEIGAAWHSPVGGMKNVAFEAMPAAHPRGWPSAHNSFVAREAREIVLKVSRENGWHEPELEAATDPRILASIANLRRQAADAVETIAEDIGSVRGRFILELTQNVEDCSFNLSNSTPWLSFEVHQTGVIVESNQDGFGEHDVRQICRTGRSWKRKQHGFVGEKGIGFKAVFQVASRVDIQSNEFSFYFVYNRHGTVVERLGLVTPLLGDDPIPIEERPLTRMTLTSNNTRYESLVAHFDIVHPTLLLFLSKIQKISITVHRRPREKTITTFSKEVPAEDTSANLTLLFKTVQKVADVSNTDTDISRYYIFRNPTTGLSEDEARPDRDGCELVLAFQVDESDRPIKPTQYDVFAYLPVGNFGFNFLIQADFILQASREEAKSDSKWNKDILSAIADSFCNAIFDFCSRDGPLRYRWVEYLPSRTALQTHHFWRELARKIIGRLKNAKILYIHGTSELRKPENVRTLPLDYLDDSGSPLFRDRPGKHGKYLSLEYGPENINTLKSLFDIKDIEDLATCHRIKHDLRSDDSKMKSGDTSNNWHSRAAHLIISILERSSGTDIETMVFEDLELIPLNNGDWVTAAETQSYFPAETGPAIPQDIVVTIDPERIVNEARDKLFEVLGATECSPDEVVRKMREEYSRRDFAPDLASSKLHLSYLYWHVEDSSHPVFSHLWIYDDNERMINTRRTAVPVYLPSEDKYGPYELFRGALPELAVPFLDPGYLDLIFPITQQTRQHGMSWTNWLKWALSVRDAPRLKFSAGSLSTEFRHILQHRPDKIIGTLKTHWKIYRPQMTGSIISEIKTADVSCWGGLPTQLRFTYFPTKGLLNECGKLGIVSRFPFLGKYTLFDYTDSPEDWAFLGRFGVQSEANITFYLDILRQHENRPQKAWNWARADILNTYSSISDHCSERNKEIIVEAFELENLILDPSCFQQSSTGPIWIDTESCVWEGPQDLLDKTPLYPLREYQNNPKIARLFHEEILKIQNADWTDYKRALSKLKVDPNPLWDVAGRAQSLYRLFSESRIIDTDWDLIRNTFEDEKLVYIPFTNQWYPPSQCLWSSPVPVEGMSVIGTDYPEVPADFFLECLRIPPASLTTLVRELCSLGERRSSVESIKEMIKAINGMNPTRQVLESLATCYILPIRRHTSGNINLGHLQETFAIIDTTKLLAIFQGHVDVLDFSLEEVHELAPFLEGLGLQCKYLSRLCTTQTACREDGMVAGRLTREFTDRAYEILRIAVSHRTPLAPQPLYDLLLASSIKKTDSISTTYTLHHSNGDTTGPITQSTGHVHIRNKKNGWQIFVPSLASNREVCYKMHFPEALTKAIEIPISCREHISLVLTSSISVIDDLLETVGVGHVPGIEAIPRRVVTESDEEDEEDEEEEGEREVVVTTAEASSRVTVNEIFGLSQVSQVSTPIPEGGSTSSSNDSYPELFVGPEADNAPNIPIQIVFGNVDAYTQILGHVIRIARQTNLPQNDFPAAPTNGQHLPGYDHQAVFGVRGLNQTRHDTKIGAAGELFAYEILLHALEPHFGIESWRSKIRHLVTVHPNYHDMPSWNERETSDIVYRDTNSHLTRLLIDLGYLDMIWIESEPEYLIEVKTTTGNCANGFFMSHNQYNLMQENALRPGHTSDKIYMVCRVYDLGKQSMNLKIYVDPEAYRQRDALLFAPKWTVRPRA